MTQGATTLSYATPVAPPPLATDVRLRLSVMMFLQFAVWGSFWMVLGIYCHNTLRFTDPQVANIYSTMALGAIISTMFAGQLADRVMSSEYLMAIFHLAGAVLLFAMARIHDYHLMYWTALAYALVYNPTLAIANSISFHNVPDATRDFPTLRVLGTIGWIVANLSIDFVLGKGADATNKPLLMGATLSLVLGFFSLTLPHTPPSGQKGDAIPFLRAFGLLRDYSFGIFFLTSFAITIALAFYYGFAGMFLTDLGVQKTATVLSFGQMAEIFFLLLLPFALKRFGMKGVLCIGMCAWAVRYGLFSLQHPFVLVLIGVILHGVCFDFFLAAGFIHTDNKAPVAIRGSAQALFTFLTYGVGMWIGNVISGQVVDHFRVGGVVHWSKAWAVPAIGAAVCLAFFLVIWRDEPGVVQGTEPRGFPIDPVAETAASPATPSDVSQTAV